MNGMQGCKLVQESGFVFKPSLQDITLKRFRMRYSLLDDCYYLHWDDAVCAPLAKIEHLSNGVNVQNGLDRYCDDFSGQLFIGRNSDCGKRAEISWKFDFSDCGLVVKKFRVRGRCSDNDDIDWRVIGDDCVGCRPILSATDDYIDITEVYGCRVVTVTAVVYQGNEEETLQLLKADKEAIQGTCPLDIKVDLMCPRSEEEGYVGEILLGIKWSQTTTDGDNRDNKLHGDVSDGQLQVYIVEGAGMVNEDSHKPFNAFIKCHLLPEGRKEHTSPRQTAFPSWAKQFHFHHVEREELVTGGLEVLLCDSHLLYNSTIAGIRLCVPHRRSVELTRASPVGSPVLRSPRSISPSTPSDPSDECRTDSPQPHPLHGSSRHSSPSPTLLRMPSPSEHVSNSKSHTFERSPQSPVPVPAFRRCLTPTPQTTYSSSHTLSPPVLRRSHSPISIAKSIFRLSGSHLRDPSSLSPITSPILGKKKGKGHQQQRDSEYVYWWMGGVSGTETGHWQQMLEEEGEWVYCWHTLRPNLKPVLS